jgi:hypothetical protein
MQRTGCSLRRARTTAAVPLCDALLWHVAEYLKQMSNISMLVSLSRQVWDDLPLTTHKCAAARVATTLSPHPPPTAMRARAHVLSVSC